MRTPGWLARLGELTRASPAEVGLVALLAMAVVGGAVVVNERSSEPPAPPIHKIAAPAAIPSPTARRLVVHVAGRVAAPGVYELPAGSRVKDAIAAAGGPRPGADVDQLNLAALCADGERILVPKLGEPVPAVDGARPAGRVNLNTATQAELEALPGVGPVLAQRILAFRQRRGRFPSTRALLEVEGVGPRKYESLKDLVTV